MKLHNLIILILVSSCSVFGQSRTCPLTMKDSPGLRGIKLGMSPEEVSKVTGLTIEPVPSKTRIYIKKEGDKYIDANSVSGSKYDEISKEKNKREIDIGEEHFFYFRKTTDKNPPLPEVENLSLHFYKNSLYFFSIDYTTNYNWKDIDGFLYVISDKLKLPRDAWDVNRKLASLVCVDFYMTVVLVDNWRPYESLVSVDTLKEKNAEAVRRFIEQDKQKGVSDSEKKKTSKR